MSDLHQCNRAILTFRLDRGYLEARFRDYSRLAEGFDESESYPVHISDSQEGWTILGLSDDFPQYDLHNFACWLFGGEDDANVPTESVIAVRYSSDSPAESYYAVASDEEEQDFGPIFRGRKDDGTGLKIDIPMGDVDELPSSGKYTEGVCAFLQARGVPNQFVPTEAGFSFDSSWHVELLVEPSDE